MDVKGQLKDKINDVVDKIKSDKDIAAKFQSNPVGTVEDLIGMDLPDDQIEGVVEAVKAKINLDKLGGGLGKLFGK